MFEPFARQVGGQLHPPAPATTLPNDDLFNRGCGFRLLTFRRVELGLGVSGLEQRELTRIDLLASRTEAVAHETREVLLELLQFLRCWAALAASNSRTSSLRVVESSGSGELTTSVLITRHWPQAGSRYTRPAGFSGRNERS